MRENGGMSENAQHGHFAAVTQTEGIALFLDGQRGLRKRVTSDGVRWTEETFAAAEPLRAVCAADGTETGADIFCLDAHGQLVEAAVDGSDVKLGRRFRPVTEAGEWYEQLPNPEEVTILRDERDGVFRAFFCARRATGRDPERRACVGEATSPDLEHWNLEPPTFAPNRHPLMFAPHVISEPGRATLFYAVRPESGDAELRYATARDLTGPFETDDRNLLARDARCAVSSALLGGRRLAFFSRRDAAGVLSVTRPAKVEFDAEERLQLRFFEGLLGLLGKTLFQTEASLTSGEKLVRVLPRYAADFRLETQLRNDNALAAGLLFRSSMTGHDNMTLWLDYDAGAISIRRGVKGRLIARAPFRLLRGETYRVSIWAEGSFADVFIDDNWVLSARTEGRTSGGFGLAVEGGRATFDAVTVQPILAK